MNAVCHTVPCIVLLWFIHMMERHSQAELGLRGHILYMYFDLSLLNSSLYFIIGHPAASRAWFQTRDAFILDRFNKEGWACHRCVQDPCLFRFTKGDDVAIGLIYTDDVDLIGGSSSMMQEICDIFHKKWGCKVVDSDFVLGVKRVVTGKDGPEMKVEMTMTAYVDGMVEAFKGHISDMPDVDTPVPVKCFLSKGKVYSKAPNPYAKQKPSNPNGNANISGLSQKTPSIPVRDKSNVKATLGGPRDASLGGSHVSLGDVNQTSLGGIVGDTLGVSQTTLGGHIETSLGGSSTSLGGDSIPLGKSDGIETSLGGSSTPLGGNSIPLGNSNVNDSSLGGLFQTP